MAADHNRPGLRRQTQIPRRSCAAAGRPAPRRHSGQAGRARHTAPAAPQKPL